MNKSIFLSIFFVFLLALSVAAAAPTISTVVGTTVEDGDDKVSITFDQDVTAADGTWDATEFSSIQSPVGTELDMTGAAFSYASKKLTITLSESDGVYLKNGDKVAVTPSVDAINSTEGNVSSDEVVSATVVSGDNTKPTATKVEMTSSNPNSAYATVGDIITLEITSSEELEEISVKIAGNDVSASLSGGVWISTYAMTADDNEGKVSFTAVMTDLAGNEGNEIKAVTTGSAVTFDKTKPLMISALTSTTTNIVVTFSEALDSGSVDSSDFSVASNTVVSTSVNGEKVTLTLGTPIAESDKPLVTMVGSVADMAGNVLDTDSSVTPSIKSQLKFVDVEWDVTFPRGEDPDDDDGVLNDGDTIEVGEGSTVVIEGDVENTFGTDVTIEDVEVNLYIKDMDDGDTYDEDDGLSDLDSGDDDSFSFEFDVPYDEFSKDEVVTATLSVEGRDDNGVIHRDEIDFKFEIEMDSEEVTIIDAYLEDSELTCDRDTVLYVKLKNTGDDDIDDDNSVTLLVTSSRLNLREIIRDIEMDEKDSDSSNERTFTFDIDAEDVSSSSAVQIQVQALVDEDEDSDDTVVYLTLSDCETPTTTTTIRQATTTTQYVPTTTSIPVIVDLPDGQESGPDYAQFPSESTISDKTSGKFSESEAYMWLLVGIFVVLVVLVVLLLVYLVRK